ncbi:MAG: hypothetical protein JJE41_14935 [Candidatus Heimdallarchaeota archaeon]|nr:hypothetical protein [Candidatus Heimdallarchaeota archaeon]
MEYNQSKERSTSLTDEEVRKLIKYKLEGKIAQLPYGFWRCDRGKEHSRIAIKYLVEVHLKLALDDVPKVLSAKTFHEAGLFRILVEFFDSSYFKALEYTYPGHFEPWQFRKGMTGIWEGPIGKKRSLQAIRNLLNALEIKFEEIPKKVSYKIFKENGLGGMLQTLYNSSPYQAINALHPGKFKPWEFSVKNYWAKETLLKARESTKWLIEEKLKFTPNDIRKVKRKHFLDFNLGQMLRIFYQNSHILALTDVYDF